MKECSAKIKHESPHTNKKIFHESNSIENEVRRKNATDATNTYIPPSYRLWEWKSKHFIDQFKYKQI